ncbi:response regulator transcription factor [Panacibacter ginsenosidivorans]|uniref:Response regulator transcription factor n=1 Tax=Panacibacter ginsenosidivorans TaxID=1813871 RepID=A0A5B8V7A2_9BACT|nr:response regulator transcription factor [Panacibacter ginsenosidivorans]QEC67390.1 response regulator transcription factor [Panacibacter ginsenosidivorans]
MEKNKIKIAIVDDHRLVIDGIRSLLEDHPSFNIIACSDSAKKMLDILKQQPVDILLTDIMMPEMNGQQLAKEVRKLFPAIKILALSMSGEGDIVSEMINDSDIAGYLLKNISKEELSAAILKIAGGGIYFDEKVLEELNRYSNMRKQNDEAHLTQREVEIIRLIEKEMSNKEIADTLFISERTVETHRKNIFRKTKTNSVIGLVKYSYEHKLI